MNIPCGSFIILAESALVESLGACLFVLVAKKSQLRGRGVRVKRGSQGFPKEIACVHIVTPRNVCLKDAFILVQHRRVK